MVATVQFAIFSIEGRRYGVGLEQVERVVRAVDVTPLPKVAAMVLGVIDVHGGLVAVLSVRQRLGMKGRAVGLSDQFIIVHTSRRRVAMVVDEVREVITCGVETIVPAKNLFPEWSEVHGIVQLENGLVLIQDLERFLSLEEDIELEEALRGMAQHGE